MKKEEKDLAPRTKRFARRIIRLHVAWPIREPDQLVTIFTTISNRARGDE
jgi:hypothetical protein